MHVSRTKCAAGFLLLLLSVPLHSQEPSAPKIGETIEVSIVNLDVVVTDKSGRRVRGLSAGDFEVRENGRVQPISNFAEYGQAKPAADRGTISVASDAVTAKPPRQPRTIVVFIERSRLLPWDAKTFFDGLKKVLRQSVGSGDQVAVLTWQTSMKVRQDFTSNIDAVDAVIDQVADENMRMSLVEEDDYEKRLEEADIAAASTPPGTSVVPLLELQARASARRAFMEMRAKTWALKSVFSAIAGNDGRKILLMATRRYSKYAGAEYFGGRMPDGYKAEFDTEPLRRDLIQSANAAGVTIYPVYPLGLAMGDSYVSAEHGPSIAQMSADRDAVRFSGPNNILMNETVSLMEVARQTGGLSDWGAANIAQMLPLIQEDLESYYSIAYRLPEQRPGQRRVDVKTKNRDYTVRFRREYVEKSDEGRMADRVVAALYRPAPEPAIAISASPILVTKEGRRYHVPLKVRIPISALTGVPQGGRNSGGFTVFVVAGGSIGVLTDVVQKKQTFTIPDSELAQARASHYTYSVELVTDRRPDTVSVGIMDDLSKQYGIARIVLTPPTE